MKSIQWIWLAVVLAFGVSGCQTSQKTNDSATLTSITIPNRSPDDIAQATLSIFRVHGFEGAQSGPNEFTFRRTGTLAGDVIGGSDEMNDIVDIRAVLTLSPADTSSMLLSCNAWIVQDQVFSSPAARKQRLNPDKYRQMLEEIKTQLAQ